MQNIWFDQWIDRSTFWLIDFTIRSSIVVLTTMALVRYVAGKSASIKRNVWTLCFCGCFLLPILQIIPFGYELPVFKAPVSSEQSTTSIDRLTRSIGTTSSLPTDSRESSNLENSILMRLHPTHQHIESNGSSSNELLVNEIGEPRPGSARSISKSISLSLDWIDTHWKKCLFAIWFSGFSIAILKLIIGRLYVKILVAQTKQMPADSILNETVRQVAGNLHVRLHPTFQIPFIAGWRTPIVVLPSKAVQWTNERVESVLQHELQHYQNSDLLLASFVNLLAAFQWFNPIVRKAVAKWDACRELVCDEQAVKSSSSPIDYAEFLLDVAKSLRPVSNRLITHSFVNQSNLEERIVYLLDFAPQFDQKKYRSYGLFVGLFVLVSTLSIGSVKLIAQNGNDQQENSNTNKNLNQNTNQNQEVADEVEKWKTQISHSQEMDAAVKEMKVELAHGNLKFHAADGESMQISGQVEVDPTLVEKDRMTDNFADNVEIVVEDGVLVVRDKHIKEYNELNKANREKAGDEKPEWVKNPWSVSLEIAVPRSVVLHARTGKGDIDITGNVTSTTVNCGKGTLTIKQNNLVMDDLAANVGKGEIQFEGTTKKANCTTGHGSIHFAQANESIERLNLTTGHGEIEADLKEVQELFNATTAHGNLKIALSDLTGKTNMSTVHGNVHLLVPEGSSFKFNASTMHGKISSNLEMKSNSTKMKHASNLTGVVGEGGPNVNASALHGNIFVGMASEEK